MPTPPPTARTAADKQESWPSHRTLPEGSGRGAGAPQARAQADRGQSVHRAEKQQRSRASHGIGHEACCNGRHGPALLVGKACLVEDEPGGDERRAHQERHGECEARVAPECRPWQPARSEAGGADWLCVSRGPPLTKAKAMTAPSTTTAACAAHRGPPADRTHPVNGQQWQRGLSQGETQGRDPDALSPVGRQGAGLAVYAVCTKRPWPVSRRRQKLTPSVTGSGSLRTRDTPGPIPSSLQP